MYQCYYYEESASSLGDGRRLTGAAATCSRDSSAREPGGLDCEDSDEEEGEDSEQADDEDDCEFMYSRTRLLGGGRRELHPLDLKIAVIERVKGGESHLSVSTDLHLPVGTVAAWWLQRDDITEKFERQAYLVRKARLLLAEEDEDEEETEDVVWKELPVTRRSSNTRQKQAPAPPPQDTASTSSIRHQQAAPAAAADTTCTRPKTQKSAAA